MGDRYELNLNCAYCNELIYGIWFAPTCGSYTFHCSKCKKLNYIKGFRAVKKEDITVGDLFEEFLDATNISWDDKDLDRIKEELEEQLK